MLPRCCQLSSVLKWGVVAAGCFLCVRGSSITGTSLLSNSTIPQNDVSHLQYISSGVLCFLSFACLFFLPAHIFSIWLFIFFGKIFGSSSSRFVFSFVPTDHSSQTVETCVWWIGREPQQHKCCHVYAETLREVSYRLQPLHTTPYYPPSSRRTLHISASEQTRPHVHQIWFHNGLFIKSGNDKARIDRIKESISAHTPTQPPAVRGFYHTCEFVWRCLFLNEFVMSLIYFISINWIVV